MEGRKIKNQDLSFNSDGELQTNGTDNLITIIIDYSGAQTDTVLIETEAEEKIELHSIYVSSATTNIDIEIKIGSTLIFKLYTSNFSTNSTPILHIDGALGEDLTVTCGAGTFIAVTHHKPDIDN